MTYKPVDTAIVMVVGPCIDDTDFKTLEEAIAYDAAGMDVSLVVEKTDGTTAVTAITLTTGGTSDWTHKDGGYYEVEVTAAQNAEEGIAYIRGVCTGVLPFESAHYDIVKANVYDSWIKGTDKLQVDTVEISGDSSAADNAELDYDGTGYDKSNSTIGTCTANTDNRELLINKVGFNDYLGNNKFYMSSGSSVDDAYEGCTVVIYDASNNDYPCVRTCIAFSGSLREVTLDSAVNFTLAVADHASIYAAHTPAADIRAALGLASADLDTQLGDIPTVAEFEARTIAAADYPTETEMTSAFTEIKGATWAAGSDTLEHIRDKQTDIEADTAEIGTAGAGLTDLGGMSTGMKAEVNAEADTALTDYDPPTDAEMIARTLPTADYVVTTDTITGVTTATNLTNAPTNGDLTATMKASVNTEAKDVLTVDTITDSYATDGNQPTIAQAILAIQQMMQDKSISGTTLTVKKPDGSTTAMTFTLDSATAPTSITRAT